MEAYPIANIFFEQSHRYTKYPALYCRADRTVFFNEKSGNWVLHGPGTFDFTTFFNGLSYHKWKKYTGIDKYYLHLELKGAVSDIFITHTDPIIRDHTPLYNAEEPAAILKNNNRWNVIDIELTPNMNDIIVGFLIKAAGPVEIRNSYYYVDATDIELRQVNLSLSTTTFKKEDFILHNIQLLRKSILEVEDDFAKHFWVHVVDNGRTLDKKALETDRIFIHYNPNSGGSGGFARGMIESLEQKDNITHVLLMDDDVEVSPESIRRTYKILTLVNDEYKDAFISGAMMNYDIGDEQLEDMGFMTNGGRFCPIKPGMRMTLLPDIVFNEVFVEPKELEEVTYAAWWYCVIPTTTIKKYGLPLPVFVRCDDSEYGIRCQPKFITMNGICVWHLPFYSRYTAAVERYQTTRNTLIAQNATNMAPKADFIFEIKNNFRIELKKYNYQNADLILDGLEDFLKGPSFIAQPVSESAFMKANKKAEKLKDFDELQKDIDDLGLDLTLDEALMLGQNETDPVDLRMVSIWDVNRDAGRSLTDRVYDYLTCNGQRTPLAREADGAAIIPAEGWAYPAGKIHRKETLIVLDAFRRKGIVRHVDKEKYKEVTTRYRKLMNDYYNRREELRQQYREAASWLTSMDFWKEYLGLNHSGDETISESEEKSIEANMNQDNIPIITHTKTLKVINNFEDAPSGDAKKAIIETTINE